MNILAIDTSTEACSAALMRADGAVFSEFEIAPRQHHRLLPGMMDQVLARSGVGKQALTHCAFANGPGAFTGIRIAAAQAQGIGMALNIPLLPISTLAVLAQACFERSDCNRSLVALDARMQEIYWAVYRRDQDQCARLEGEEQLCAVDRVRIADGVDCGAGHGWIDALREQAAFDVDAGLLPDARALLTLAADAAARKLGVEASAAGINYLRNRVAEKQKS